MSHASLMFLTFFTKSRKSSMEIVVIGQLRPIGESMIQ